MAKFSEGSVPVAVAAKVYGKDPNWVRGSKKEFYELYRRFFYILDQERR